MDNDRGEFLTTEVILKTGQTITITNTYRNPKNGTKEQVEAYGNELTNLIKGDNHFIVGDINAQSENWGPRDNTQGVTLNEIIQEKGLIIWNNGDITRLAENKNERDTAIDITLTSQLKNIKIEEWEVHSDPLGSDHFPIKTTLKGKVRTEKDEENDRIYYKRKNINWDEFRTQCISMEWDKVKHKDINIYTNNFINKLKEITLDTIPNSTNGPLPRKATISVPWWNDNCKEAKSQRLQALKNYTKNRSEENKKIYRDKRNQATTTIRKAREEFFRANITKLNENNNIKEVWNLVKAIDGKKKGKIKVGTLRNKDGKLTIEDKDKANTLATQFQQVSSDDNYTEKFKKEKMNHKNLKKHLFEKNKMTKTL